MRILAVLCLLLFCCSIALIAFFDLGIPNNVVRKYFTEDGLIASDIFFLYGGFLFNGAAKRADTVIEGGSTEGCELTLDKKFAQAGVVGDSRELYKTRLYFEREELFLTFGELGKLFEYAVQGLRPPYTEIVFIERYNLSKTESGYITTVKLRVDFGDRFNKFFNSGQNSVLYIFAEIQTYIDSSGFIHCYSLSIDPINAEIGRETADYALTLLFKDAEYNKIIFFIYENMVKNIGNIGLESRKGSSGVTDSGVYFLTYSATAVKKSAG